MDNARELSSRLLDLLRCERSAMADFLVALADFDRHRRWVELGHSSLFYYLRRELELSAGAAYLRKTAAELIQRFPEVVVPLREGRLCLSSVGELAKVLTAENRGEVLPRFFHTSKAQAKAVAAELAPRAAPPLRAVLTQVAPRLTAGGLAPPAAATVRSHPEAGGGPSLALGQAAFHPGEMGEAPARSAAASFSPPPPPRSTTEPLTAELRRLHVTVSKRFLEKLDASRAALSHSHPQADMEAILEAGLDLLLERAANRRGLVKRPRALAPAADVSGSDPRHVPAAVRREVWLRDEGRCRWPTADGAICGSTHRLELDHVVPVARGGRSTVANLRVTCDFHNDLAARAVYGDSWMDRFTGAGSRRSRSVGEADAEPPSRAGT
jgi:hypothetical protein